MTGLTREQQYFRSPAFPDGLPIVSLVTSMVTDWAANVAFGDLSDDAGYPVVGHRRLCECELLLASHVVQVHVAGREMTPAVYTRLVSCLTYQIHALSSAALVHLGTVRPLILARLRRAGFATRESGSGKVFALPRMPVSVLFHSTAALYLHAR